MRKELFVYDIETLTDFFCVVFSPLNPNIDASIVFEISNFKNEYKELLTFLKDRVIGLWGFNNKYFDQKVLQWIIENPNCIAESIYSSAQDIISNKGWYHDCVIPQADIYKIKHYDRYGVSLKQCEIAMDSAKVLDMPIHHTESIDTRVRADIIIEYCKYDVNQTKKQIHKNISDLELRQVVKKEYNNLKNPYFLSDTAIGRETMLYDYCNTTKDDPEEVKERKTIYTNININEVISNKIEFKTKKLKDFLLYLKNKKINLAFKSLEELIDFDDVKYELKKGGLHSVHKGDYKNIIFKSNDKFKILDLDYSSYYPFLLYKLKIAPNHLNREVFCNLIHKYILDRLHYKDLYKEYQRKEDNAKATALKLKINSIYGLLGAEYGFLQDKKAMYQVTLNGQLFLLMLIESLSLYDIHCFYANTKFVGVLKPL
jgi:hypothetical protein